LRQEPKRDRSDRSQTGDGAFGHKKAMVVNANARQLACRLALPGPGSILTEEHLFSEHIMITGIAHACYTVRSLPAAVEFYVEKLGLKLAFEFVRETGERYGAYIHVGGRNFIELFEGLHGEDGDVSYRHLCLEVDDIERTVDELREKEIDVNDPKLGGDHSWQAWIQDPDGNRIELHGYTETSKQRPYLKQEGRA
jgi:catechol 2,3-dioxygenase-like lactoylglutathione lyase family enzyme